MRGRQSQAPHHLLFVLSQQLADRRRCAEYTGRAGDVPAHVIVIRIHHIADAARGFHAQHQRIEKLLARYRFVFRQRQYR